MMDPATLQRRRHEREVFHRLFDMPASARDAHIAGIEASDTVLAAKLRRLLEDAEAEAGAQVEDRAGDRVGAVIGLHFRLVRLLGIGGHVGNPAVVLRGGLLGLQATGVRTSGQAESRGARLAD